MFIHISKTLLKIIRQEYFMAVDHIFNFRNTKLQYIEHSVTQQGNCHFQIGK